MYRHEDASGQKGIIFFDKRCHYIFSKGTVLMLILLQHFVLHVFFVSKIYTKNYFRMIKAI